MDEAIDHFMAFTGSTADVARRYLGLTDNNTEQAIQLFFDSPDLASSTEPPPIPTSTRPAVRATNVGQEDASGVVHLDSDNEEGMDIDDPDENEAASQAEALSRAADYEDDEAIARRMQEELYAGGDASGGYDADGVRAPIGRRTETLVGGPDGDWPPDDMHAAVLQQMRNRQQARSCMYFFHEPVQNANMAQLDPASSTNNQYHPSGTNRLMHQRVARVWRKQLEEHRKHHPKRLVSLSYSGLLSSSCIRYLGILLATREKKRENGFSSTFKIRPYLTANS